MSGTWRTKDGRTLNISSMETSHIKNCITMLRRKREDVARYLEDAAGTPYSMDEALSWASLIIDATEGIDQKINEFEQELQVREDV